MDLFVFFLNIGMVSTNSFSKVTYINMRDKKKTNKGYKILINEFVPWSAVEF